MRKLVIVLISLMFFATACSDGEDAFDFDPNVSAGTMDSITVTDYGAVTPEHFRTIVKIDAERVIELTTEEYENFDAFVHSCTEWAEVTESEHEAVVEAVAAADIANYVPPSEEDGCEPLVGTQGYGIDYRMLEGGIFTFDTGTCPLDEEIENLISAVTTLAGQYFADSAECTSDDGTKDKDDDDDDDDGVDSDIVVYDVPLINPRDIPRPTRVKP